MAPKLLIISREFEPQIAGVSAYISEIEKRLGFEKTVVAQHMRGRKRKDVVGLSYPINLTARHLKALYFLLSSVSRSLSLKYDVIIGNALIGSAAAAVLKVLTRKPMVSIIYDVDYVAGASFIRPGAGLRKFLQRMILAVSDAVIVDSNKVKNDIIKIHKTPAGKIRVVESGFTAERGLGSVKKPGGKKIILFVGINTKKKGLEDLVNAFAVVRKSVPGCLLWVVGPNTGFLRPFHKELVGLARSLGVYEGVKFFGEVPSTSPYYRACDVFVLPSHHSEGFGIPCVEAGHFSKPVVATKIFAETGVVIKNRTGIIVSPHRPDEISKAVLKILKNPSYAKRLGRNGKIHSARYSWDRAAEEFERVINDL